MKRSSFGLSILAALLTGNAYSSMEQMPGKRSCRETTNVRYMEQTEEEKLSNEARLEIGKELRDL